MPRSGPRIRGAYETNVHTNENSREQWAEICRVWHKMIRLWMGKITGRAHGQQKKHYGSVGSQWMKIVRERYEIGSCITLHALELKIAHYWSTTLDKYVAYIKLFYWQKLRQYHKGSPYNRPYFQTVYHFESLSVRFDVKLLSKTLASVQLLRWRPPYTQHWVSRGPRWGTSDPKTICFALQNW